MDIKEKNFLYFRVLQSSKTNPSHLKSCVLDHPGMVQMSSMGD